MFQSLGKENQITDDNMVSNGTTPLVAFLAQHKTQLEGTGVPQVTANLGLKYFWRIILQIYWPTLLNKLEKQQFDAGNAFSILQYSFCILDFSWFDKISF